MPITTAARPFMLTALKNIFTGFSDDRPEASASSEQRRLHLAVVGLLNEMMRMDAAKKQEEAHTDVAGLVDMLGLGTVEAGNLLVE